jgi:hypothetical protein
MNRTYTTPWGAMTLEEKLDDLLQDIYRRRAALDAAIAGVKMVRAMQKAESSEGVCVVDISRCPTLIEAMKDD